MSQGKVKRFIPIVAAVPAALVLIACGPAATAPAPAFPTTHVTLYDCGLAQIERQADVSGAMSLEISVEQAHLDDLLASLVLATDGSVKVKGVDFPAVHNLGQAVASSGFAGSMLESGSIELPSDLAGYAQALAGTNVVLSTIGGESVEGTILDSVQPFGQPGEVTADGKPVQQPEPVVILVTADGALRWFDVGEIAAIAPTSHLESASMKGFATALGKANGLSETTLTLTTTGDSEGKLAASYIRQSPVWRMVYRTRVSEGKVVLEAWAVVHNDSPEDWTDVSMTLISGLPTSYVLSLASPRYVYREVMEAPGSAAEMMPQLGAATPDSLLYTWDITHEGYGGLSTYGFGAGGGGYGYGYGSGSGSLSGIGYGSGEMGSSLLALGESAAAETMEPAVEDEISTYTSMSKVTLPSGSTSLVPLVRRELPGQAFTRLAGWGEPETCVRIENTTGLVLQPGMSTFFEDGRFRGQATMDRVEPGDVRVLCFGRDEDITSTSETEVKNRYAAVEWKDERLWVHTLRTTTIDYEIENMAGKARDVAIQISHIVNGRILEPKDNLSTDAPTVELHPISVPGLGKVEIRVVVEEGVMSEAVLTDVAFGLYLGEDGAIQADQAKLLAAVRPTIVEKEKIGKQVEEKNKAISKLDTAIAWQEELLAKVPETDGKSKSVDSILAEIVKAKKEIAVLTDEIEALGLKAADLMEKVAGSLEGMPRPTITADSLKAGSPSL